MSFRATITMVALTAAASLAAYATIAHAGPSSKDDVTMISTGHDQDARGRAIFTMRTTTQGRLEVRVRQLAPDTTYELLLDDVRIGDITTSGGGTGRARFRSRPRADKDDFLGFDPRGGTMVIRDDNGVDLLAVMIPASAGATTDVACCIPDDSGPECEDRTPDECVAAGGTVSTATSCLPDPCGGTTVPQDRDIVCCIPDDSGPECEDRTVEECAVAGAIAVEAGSCTDNPCAGTPAADPDTRCCLPDDSGTECEDRTPAECAAQGGTDIGAGVCSLDACAGVVLPGGGATPSAIVTCEKRASRSRASVNGTGLAAGTYRARLGSGANEASSGLAAAVNSQAEFDFDSDGGDIAAGSTAIAAGFLLGSPPQALGQILDTQGNVIAENLVTCTVK